MRCCCYSIASFFFRYSRCQYVVKPSGFSPLISTGMYFKWSLFDIFGALNAPAFASTICCMLFDASAGAKPSSSGSDSSVSDASAVSFSSGLKMLICCRKAF